jgi:hypothetical protein
MSAALFHRGTEQLWSFHGFMQKFPLFAMIDSVHEVELKSLAIFRCLRIVKYSTGRNLNLSAQCERMVLLSL